ncbi:MAG: hypothetical protein R3B48_01710 [Kofleriaceae bacterium]
MQPKHPLSEAEARAYLEPFARAFYDVDEVDPAVLAYGSSGAGALVYDGLRTPSLRVPETNASTFFEGNVWVDGWFENPGQLVFVRGNLVAHSIYTHGYLVVAGELRCERFLGEDEPYGTYVLGDAVIADAVGSHNHQFCVLGRREIRSELHDERHGRGAVRQRFVDWGALRDPSVFHFLEEVRAGLRAWAATCGPLPSDWLTTPYADPAPPPAPPPKPAPPPVPPTLAELTAWLADAELSQREKLAQLEPRWLPRLLPEERAEAARLIRRAINSKRLAAELAAVLAKLA